MMHQLTKLKEKNNTQVQVSKKMININNKTILAIKMKAKKSRKLLNKT